MSADESNIEDRVSCLPHKERARLALKLIESLDPGTDEDVAELWLNEAEQRLRKYDEGATEARNVSDAISEIDHRLK